MPLVPSSSRHTSTSIPLWFQSNSRSKKSALKVSAIPTSSSSEQTSDNDRRSSSNPQRPRGSFNSDRRGPPRGDFRGGGGRGRGGGRSGGGRGRGGPPQQQQGPVLKLQNPLTINRLVDQTPADTDKELYAERRPPRNDNSDNNNNNQQQQRGRGPPRGGRGGGPVASTDAGGRVTSEFT